MKKKYMILLSALSLASSTFAQTWIWYPGDYEIWLGNQMNNRRTERGAFFPPFWKTDSHYVVVEFSKQLNLSGEGKIEIYYGESPEEAKDKAYCETLDKLLLEPGQVTDLAIRSTSPLSNSENEYTLENSKAFRYVYVTHEPGVQIGEVSMQYEYLPEEYRGNFRCNDEELNRIWEVGAYTMHLTTREFFIDGIKRDRWVWSGDAIQSYLMNYYLFFDNESVKRTIWLLRGKDPVTSHSNTIMDYTFYWFLSVYDYYMYSGDRHFVNQLYPRMQTMMDYVLGRTNKNGMVEGMTGDWVFVDWADGYLIKKGNFLLSKFYFAEVWKQWLCVRNWLEMPMANRNTRNWLLL